VSYPYEMKFLFLTYCQINVRDVSDWNQNIINKVCSVENIAIEKIINDMDSLCILEDYKHDFGDTNELFHCFQDMCVKKNLGQGMFSIVENSTRLQSARNATCASWFSRA
jgi:hypothetical protein